MSGKEGHGYSQRIRNELWETGELTANLPSGDPVLPVKGKMMLSELFAPEHSCCVIFKWFRYLYIR